MNTIAKMSLRGQEGEGRRAEARPTVAACEARSRGPSLERQPLSDRRTAVARMLAARSARRRQVPPAAARRVGPGRATWSLARYPQAGWTSRRRGGARCAGRLLPLEHLCRNSRWRGHPSATLQGLRLMLALAMAHEHLIRFDQACYQGCAATGTHGARQCWARSTLLVGGSRTVASGALETDLGLPGRAFDRC